MSNLKGTNVASPIVPFTTDDTYATHEAKYGKGGYRTVSDLTERNAIPEARLEEGMLVYVVNDPDNIHTYQYINGEWTKSKIGAGVEKVETILERDSLTSEEGDLVYVGDTGQVYEKLGDDYWRPISIGIPILTKQQEDELSEVNKLPDDFISIPDPGELEIPTETTEYESVGRGYYLDIIFSTIRALQAEVAKLRNSFTYGINSYTGKDTAMGRVVGSYNDIPEQEPLWDVDEADLSLANVEVDVTNNNSLTPSENVTIGPGYLDVSGSASWVNPEFAGFAVISDPKLYIFMTTSSLKVRLCLSRVEDESEKIYVDLSTLGLNTYEDSRYNIMFCLSRTIVNAGETYGNNYLWISVGNYLTGGVENQGYWNPLTNRLQMGLVPLDYRYTFSNVMFTDLNLYKFNGYSKFQDLSSTVDPVIPTDDTYKYRVAHITIRSVKNESDLQSIKNQLPANELIYNEQTGVLWIKTSSGTVRPISGSGGQIEEGMDKSEIKEWLEQNGIIVYDDGFDSTNPYETSVKLNDIGYITFIHQATGKKFKFSVDGEGNLSSEEIPEVLLTDRMKTANFNVNDEGGVSYGRGFVGLLGFKELNYGSDDISKNIGLHSDRVKIGSIYAPYSSSQPTYGCTHAFIELENTSNEDFPLDGCYLHYATGTSSGSSSPDDIAVYHLELHGVIPAGGTYLIRGKKYSDPEQANTFINVSTFDQEWYVEKDNKIELIDLTQNNNNSYLLTYGRSISGNEINYDTQVIKANDGSTGYPTSKFPVLYHTRYIDSVAIRNFVTKGTSVPSWNVKTVGTSTYYKCFLPTCGVTDGPYRDVIYKNTFELDPANQAYQSCNTADSSRARNANDADYQYLILEKDVIEFPKTAAVYPVARYTPRASWEHKNVCTDKSKLNREKPNMVTVSFGIDMYRTRCFNWISCGRFDEYIWIREKGTSTWEARFESYKDAPSAGGTNLAEKDDTMLTGADSGMRKKTFGTFTCRTGTPHSEPIQKYIYDRMTGIFPADGTNYTSHKCIVDVISTALSSGTQTYEYVVGRADKNLNPDPNHISEIQEFTLYSTEHTPRVFQVTDQQGFHWIEYQCWAAAAEEVNNTITSALNDNNLIMPVLINTGDMTQNGTRINEWLDYYNGGYCLFNHLEQANLVGNNDLCGTNPEVLGTGDDVGKSNGYYFHVFYCYEIDESILPIISNQNATKYVPSLYYFQDNQYRFVILNTEITLINCRDWYKQIMNETYPVNVYTGWTVPSDINVEPTYDTSFTNDGAATQTVYTMIYNMLDTEKEVITACHEMPFTVITQANLKTGGTAADKMQSVDRSLNGDNTSGALVGCHCNRLGNTDRKGIYWLSRLLEHFKVKLCIGGHKHTYACTNPLREFYYYIDNGETKCSINGPMSMPETLQTDSAIWTTNINGTDGGKFNIDQGETGITLTFNTTKFPLMAVSNSADYGITKDSTAGVFYPYYGVQSLSPGTYSDGVIYFMCQATGFKLKSNKELPSPNQKFSYVIPQTTFDSSGADKPSSEQQLPMFSEIYLNGSKSYTIYLYRINGIMLKKSTLFSQVNYSTAPFSFNYLKGNESAGDNMDPIFGKWYNVKTALINIT